MDVKRYFGALAYNGTAYSGWQRQPNDITIQQIIEESIFTILREEIPVTGCGRTDAGVHASQYYLHFDTAITFPEGFVARLNSVLPADIAFRQIFEVDSQKHARFDAIKRSYQYHLHFQKSPFHQHTAYHFPFEKNLDLKLLQEAAKLLLAYEAFFPFCKTNTDVKTMRCQIFRAEWIPHIADQKLVFHISANRFLRGMVRLIVGMCLNVGLGKVSLDQVRHALDTQTRLDKSYSVPARGLFLTEVIYGGESEE